jgi:carbamoyl-phosphate synthase large subunit
VDPAVSPLTILVSSAGRRVGLLKCFREAAHRLEIALEILACDADPSLSAACHVADRAFTVPRCDDPKFIPSVLGIALDNRVRLVVPTIDPELELFSSTVKDFTGAGIRVHISAPDVVDMARDKLRTARHLEEIGVSVPATNALPQLVADSRQWKWPLLLKPRRGSASRGLRIAKGPQDLLESFDEPMVAQELIQGPEYTVNIYVDQAGRLRSVIPHRRLRVRGGEVEKGRTEASVPLTVIANRIVDGTPGAWGTLCFQAIVDPQRGPVVFEINARFGGGYPLTDFVGGRFAQWLLEETAGLPSTITESWEPGVTMLRYDEAVFVRSS